MLQAVTLLRERFDLPVWAKPQAKLSDKCATGRSSETPEKFARHARALADAGAAAVGGCCGTTPAEHRRPARGARSANGEGGVMTLLVAVARLILAAFFGLTTMHYDRGLATRFGDPGDHLTGKHLSCTHEHIQPDQLDLRAPHAAVRDAAAPREPAHRPVRGLPGARPRPVRRHPADGRMGRQDPQERAGRLARHPRPVAGRGRRARPQRPRAHPRLLSARFEPPALRSRATLSLT